MRKRVVGLVVALVAAVLGLGLVAAPAKAATGTITVTAPADAAPGSNRTYYLYRVFVGSGNGTNIRYNTVNTDSAIEGVLTSKGWTLPDVKGKYEEANGTGTFDETTVEHFIFDDTGSVHWGTVKDASQAETNTDGATVYEAQYITDAATTALPDYAIEAIADYVKGDSPVGTASATGTNSAEFYNVADGYYYITTTTGSVVSIDSANTGVTVSDKNEPPTMSKIISQVSDGSISSDQKSAIAQYGATVTYQVRVNFGAGSENVVLHDTFDGERLALATAPVVRFYDSGDSEITSATDDFATVRSSLSTTKTDAANTIRVDFKDGIDGSASYATVTYSVTVTSDALSETAAKNEAYVSYGSDDASQTENDTTSVYNATYTVTKTDAYGNYTSALNGAGFVLRKDHDGSAGTYDYRYYKYTPATTTTNGTVSWQLVEADVTTQTGEGTTYEVAARTAARAGNITELTTTSDAGGNVLTFTGLSDGTYTLYELDVPGGYLRASDVTFTVSSATADDAFEASNLQQSVEVVNRTGSELPSTGQMGTTIFYLVGAALAVGGVLIVRRRRSA